MHENFTCRVISAEGSSAANSRDEYNHEHTTELKRSNSSSYLEVPANPKPNHSSDESIVGQLFTVAEAASAESVTAKGDSNKNISNVSPRHIMNENQNFPLKMGNQQNFPSSTGNSAGETMSVSSQIQTIPISIPISILISVQTRSATNQIETAPAFFSQSKGERFAAESPTHFKSDAQTGDTQPMINVSEGIKSETPKIKPIEGIPDGETEEEETCEGETVEEETAEEETNGSEKYVCQNCKHNISFHICTCNKNAPKHTVWSSTNLVKWPS
jgi:hypothetical protein